MPRIRIDVAADGMLAHISVAVGEAVMPAALDAALDEAGVCAGIDDAVRAQVAALLADPEAELPSTLIARGVPPQRGFDGYFTPAFEPGIRPGHLRDDGSMDFRDRELLKTVRAGDHVGKLALPTGGVPGLRVDGVSLPARPGTVSPLKLGEGIASDAQGALSALAGGAILYVPQRSLAIVRHLAHRGDVDLRSGHLDMQGSVLVQGSVTRGFHVRATGDVDVRGQCDGGEIQAGGNVRVMGTLRGGDQGGVQAEGAIVAARAESVELRAGGTITLHEAVHAHLYAHQIAITKRVFGGVLEAEHAIDAESVGSAQGMATELRAGVLKPSTADLKRAVDQAKAERFARQRALASPRGDERPKGGKLGREQGGLVRGAIEQKIALAKAREELLRHAYVEVRGTLHAGSVIGLGDERHEIREDLEKIRFSFDVEARTLRLERIAP